MEGVGVSTLEHKEVVALFKSDSRSFKSTLIDIEVRYSTDFNEAIWKASAINVGWIPAKFNFHRHPTTFAQHFLRGMKKTAG